MKKNGLLAEMLDAVIQYNRKKIKTSKPNPFLNQKKQLWFGMMNIVDEDIKIEKDAAIDAQDS